jgi:hypothetical protein
VRQGLIGEVAATMARDRSAVWLLPDPLGHPGKRSLREARTAYFVVDDDVY